MKEDLFKGRLEKLERLNLRVDKLVRRAFDEAEVEFRQTLKQWEDDKTSELQSIESQQDDLKHQHDQAAKDFTQKKYVLERDANANRNQIKMMDQEISKVNSQYEAELKRLNDLKTKTIASYERQNSALHDLYREKRKNLSSTRAKLASEYESAKENFNSTKKRIDGEISQLKSKHQNELERLNEEKQAKEQGWNLALDSLKKELDTLVSEKESLQKKLESLRGDTEDELKSVRSSMQITKEQMEVDKATLIEKAESDIRQCEKDVTSFQEQVIASEKGLQDLVINKDKQEKNEEEAYQKEESALREAVQKESEKRDYEQKLLEQERTQKEKELNRVKDEYEKKKWYWDNQVRNLMMKKSVQESEFEAERMRHDREARVGLKSLEAKRDELRQRLNEIKSRRGALEKHQEKETELRRQRWQWRKDRLWSMWRNRLDVLKKERLAIQEQLETFNGTFDKEKDRLQTEEARGDKRVEDLKQGILQDYSRNDGHRQQKEIQNELEKTRVLAQIKECESLIVEWTDHLKTTQDEINRQNMTFGNQLAFLETLYRDEEKETEAFLFTLRKTLGELEGALARLMASEDAA